MNETEFNTGVIRPVECVKEAFELIKPDFWLLLAINIVGGIIGGFSACILFGAMICGINYAYLKRIDGKRVSFDDLWQGFRWWLPALGVSILIIVPMMVVCGVIYIPLLMGTFMGARLSSEELIGLLVGGLAIDLVLSVIMVCLHTLLIFSFPLIVDRDLGAVKAITTSARAVLKNMGGVAGLIAVNFGLMLAGLIALCFGVYLVMPVIVAGNLVAYRKVFPLQTQNFGSSRPNAQPGL